MNNTLVLYANKEHLLNDLTHVIQDKTTQLDISNKFNIVDSSGNKTDTYYFIYLYDLNNRVELFQKYRKDLIDNNEDYTKIYYYNYNMSNRKSEELMVFEFLEECGLGKMNISSNLHNTDMLKLSNVYNIPYLYKKPPGYVSNRNPSIFTRLSYLFGFT